LAVITFLGFVRTASATHATLGNYPKLFTVDPNGHGDFQTIDCAVKKIKQLYYCDGRTYSECGIGATSDCDPIAEGNPYTIYLAPGVHGAEGPDFYNLRGLSIVGMGGVEGTILNASGELFHVGNSDVRLEGLTLVGYEDPDISASLL